MTQLFAIHEIVNSSAKHCSLSCGCSEGSEGRCGNVSLFTLFSTTLYKVPALNLKRPWGWKSIPMEGCLVSGSGCNINMTSLTCGHLPISCSRPIGNHTLDLEELIRFVASDNSEAKAHVALLEWCGQETAFQLSGVPREQRLLCN